jgi:hypothetical protein
MFPTPIDVLLLLEDETKLLLLFRIDDRTKAFDDAVVRTKTTNVDAIVRRILLMAIIVVMGVLINAAL